MRIEHSRFIKSIDEEKVFLGESTDKCALILDIINKNAEFFVRQVPFNEVWDTYWKSIKQHLFIFNE